MNQNNKEALCCKKDVCNDIELCECQGICTCDDFVYSDEESDCQNCCCQDED